MLPEIEPELAPPPSSRTNGARRPKRVQEPTRYKLELRLDGRLWLVKGSEASPVEVVRCLPWTRPEKWLSLRDGGGVERAFIGDLWELDNDSRAALNAVLSRSAFVLEVTRVLGVEEDFELRSFQVETEQGPRRFQTSLDAWPRELAGGGLVLEDVHGDLYRLSTPNALDAQSRKWLRALLD
jgi:hypothetical protein